MSSEQDSLEQIVAAKERDDWKACIELCRAALKDISKLGVTDRFRLWKFLALALLEVDTNKDVNCEEAIQIYKTLIPQLDENSVEWEAIHRYIGYAYQERKTGERADNLSNVIYYYEQALSVPDNNIEDELLASIHAEIAYSLNELTELDSTNNNENLIQSREHLLKALEVFTSDQYPEEYDQIHAALLWVDNELL